MLYIRITSDGNVWPATSAEAQPAAWTRADGRVESRWDWYKTSLAHVEALAAKLSATTGKHYIGTDAGESTSPRYDIIEVPKVGDVVSYTFNGDYYPCGTITKISESLKVITTSEGKKFYRRRDTGSWINNGTWSLIPGHHDERNPSF